MIEVTCAIIEKDGKVLATKRAHGVHLAGKWEFPGGKIEPGETAEQCIKREIAEELNISISVVSILEPLIHHYLEKSILLIPFICKIEAGEIRLRDHSDFRWIDRDEIKSIQWADADMAVVGQYLHSSPK
jgi:8-oxo-dGTP diphosphatase